MSDQRTGQRNTTRAAIDKKDAVRGDSEPHTEHNAESRTSKMGGGIGDAPPSEGVRQGCGDNRRSGNRILGGNSPRSGVGDHCPKRLYMN